MEGLLNWVEIAMFAEAYQDYLRKYIELENGVPSRDTINRVMGFLSPEILQQFYGKWQELSEIEHYEERRNGKRAMGNVF